MKKSCPKCLVIFECLAENIEKCQCNSIKLDQHQKGLLQATYTDCLCINCLKSIQESTNSTHKTNQQSKWKLKTK